MIDRRTFIFASSALVVGCAQTRTTEDLRATKLSNILATLGSGARLGVAAIDTETGRRIGHDADSRYAMCSTFKAPLAAMMLAEADAGRVSLSEELPVSEADVIFHSPVVKENLARGRMTVEELSAAIVRVSDNAAANILLKQVGGPAGFTSFLRRCGDDTTRLDRIEPELNMNTPGDPRDTTTPSAMLDLMQTLLLGNALTPVSRQKLIHWMETCTTGLNRLRAGFPAEWRAGDKTGTSNNGANNDLAIAWPPNRHPILVMSFIDARQTNSEAMNAAHQAVARQVAAAFA